MNNYTRTEVLVTPEMKITSAQAKQVLQAIETLRTATMDQLVEEVTKLGMASTSKQGNKMVVRWYLTKSFIPNGLVKSEAIKIEKKVKETTPVTPKTKSKKEDKVIATKEGNIIAVMKHKELTK